jgi:LysR family transcriptional regulator, hydrogen peroxide-inducible genes activator
VELYQIKYFLALCGTLNFARAAEQCNVSQPSLTRAVQKLEQELGGPLICRERRFTHLTDLGELVRPMLQEVLDHANMSRSAAREFLQEDRRTLKLGILSSIRPDQFAPFLSRFATRQRSIQIKFVDADSATLQKLLLDGDLDYAVSACGDDAHGRLRRYQLYREGMVAVIPRGHALESQAAVLRTSRVSICCSRLIATCAPP